MLVEVEVEVNALKFQVWLVPDGPGLVYAQDLVVETSPITGLKLAAVNIAWAFIRLGKQPAQIKEKSKIFFMGL